MDWVGIKTDVKKAGRYYRLFVLAQAMLFFAVIVVRNIELGRRVVEARTKAVFAEIGGLKTALGMFEVDCTRFPTTEEGLSDLIEAPKDGSLTNWHGPYLDLSFAPEDPWGHPYVYRFPSLHSTNGYDLYSLGPDGVSKSGGNDLDDISNWDSQPRN